jgi:hypothetical protein
MAQTWTELLDDIKVRGMIPTSQNTFTEARLLRLANATLKTKIVSLVDKVREGYYSYDVDTTLNATGVYNIHGRAVGGKLLNAAIIQGDEKKELTRYYEESIVNFNTPNGSDGFFLKRSQVVLVPKVPSGDTFRQTILLRPLQIVAQTDAAQITNINTGTGVVTCSLVPSSWTTANTFDLCMAEPHFDTLSIDLDISAVTTGASGTLTFTPADLPSRLAVGDWIGLAGQSTVVQCPDELLPLLAQEVANVALKSQSDLTAYKLGVEAVKEMKDDIMTLISPRVENEGKKIVNRTGMLRRGL